MDGLCFAAPFVATLQSFYEWELRRTQSTFSKWRWRASPGEAAGCSQEGIGRQPWVTTPWWAKSRRSQKWLLHFFESSISTLVSAWAREGATWASAVVLPFFFLFCRYELVIFPAEFIMPCFYYFRALAPRAFHQFVIGSVLVSDFSINSSSMKKWWKNDEQIWTNMKKYGNIWKKCMFSFGYAQVFPRSRSCNSGIESLGDSVMGCPESAPNHRPKTKSRSLGANCSLSTCATSKKRRIVFNTLVWHTLTWHNT